MDNENKIIPIIKDNTKYWIVRSGVEGTFFNDFYYDNSIALGWDKIECVDYIKKMESVEPLKEIVLNTYLNELKGKIKEKNISRKISDIANKIYKFVNEIKIGDIIITPGSKEVLIGEVTGEAVLIKNRYNDIFDMFNPEAKEIGELNKVREVKWIKRINRDDIEPNLKLQLRVIHGISQINNEQVITEINRSLYNFYTSNNSGHTIYRIKSTKEINFSKYAFFIKSINEVYELLKEDFEHQELVIKTNVQSPGPIELIGDFKLVKNILAAVTSTLKNNNEALKELPAEQRSKVEEYARNNSNEYDYDDYEFPSIGGY